MNEPEKVSLDRYVSTITNETRTKLWKAIDVYRWRVDETLEEQNLCLIVTGSDWRLENIPEWSNLELVVVWDIEQARKDINLHWLLEEIIRGNPYRLTAFEEKDLATDTLSCFRNESMNSFPTRVLDSRLISGCKVVYSFLRERISHEVINDSKILKNFWNITRVQKKKMKKWEASFKWRTFKQYDLDKWIAYYNPVNYQENFKTWPLRVIQFTLALALLRLIRNQGQHLNFVDELPTNIPKRLEYMRDNKITWLSESEIEDLKYIYSYFLKLYHTSQYWFHAEWKTEHELSHFQKEDIKDMIKAIEDILWLEWSNWKMIIFRV